MAHVGAIVPQILLTLLQLVEDFLQIFNLRF